MYKSSILLVHCVSSITSVSDLFSPHSLDSPDNSDDSLLRAIDARLLFGLVDVRNAFQSVLHVRIASQPIVARVHPPIEQVVHAASVRVVQLPLVQAEQSVAGQRYRQRDDGEGRQDGVPHCDEEEARGDS